MPHTEGRYMQDLGFTDGIELFNPKDAMAIASAGGPAVLTRNAAGDIVWNVPNSTTETFTFSLYSSTILRTGFGEDLQEQFGGAGIAGSAQPQFYRPDVLGAMAAAQQLQPRTANKIKGIKITGLQVRYKVLSANATALTCRMDKIVYVNGGANVITSILASAANGLTNVFSANMVVATIALPAAIQIYQIADLTDLLFEIGVQTPGGGTFQLYGIRMLVEFNYN